MTAHPIGTTTAAAATGHTPAYTPPLPAPPLGAAPAPLGYPLPPGPPPMAGAPKRPRRNLIGILSAVLAAGLIGGGVGAIVTNQTSHGTNTARTSSAPPPTAAQVRDANVKLCTAYATINSAMPKPQENALQVLPGVNGLRLALADTPAASPEIREAIGDVVNTYDALIASFGQVRVRGLAQPQPYDVAAAQRILDHAWDVCQLG